MAYNNSPLVDYVKRTGDCNAPRSQPIRKITIHHMAGMMTVEQCGELFFSSPRSVSSNYGIDSDGRVGLYVDEANRAWTSSSAANDQQAVTIEVANCGGAPDWPVSDAAFSKLIDLCVDICWRNGIERLNYTGDASGNLTMHKWFAATACPGPSLESRFPEIAAEVNRRLAGTDKKTEGNTLYRVQMGAFAVKANADAMLAKVHEDGYEAFVAEVDGLYKVQVGAFAVKANADAYLEEIRDAGYDAFIATTSPGSPVTETVATRSIEDVAREVIAGKWGNGAARRRMLEEAGLDYNEVQATVELLLK